MPSARSRGGGSAGTPGVEAQDVEQLVDVDVLGRQPAAQHVVGRRHDLDAAAAQVGVQVPGREVDGVARARGARR